MFKLVVLFVVVGVAVGAPAPGLLHDVPLTYAVPHVIPGAVSHSSRVDYHSKPIITTYAAAPIVAHHAVVAAPIIKDYGHYGYGLGDVGHLGYGGYHGYSGYGW